MENAKEHQQQYEQDLKDRLEKKVRYEKDQSELNFKHAIKKFHETSRLDRKTFITDSPDARS